MYLKMFEFTEKPFHLTPNPRFIFLSKNHKEAFAHLLYGVQQRVGFLSLTGEVGTGKTTVLRTLLEQLSEADYRVALIFNPCLTALELLQTIHREFGIDYDASQSNLVSLHESLNQFLLQQRSAGKTVVLVIDEAQNLDPTVLEQLRLLSNLETETEKLIQMIMVGQPELDEILERNDLRQLRQRLAVRYQLRSMDEGDTNLYIKHRLRIAGWQNGELFTDRALEKIFRFSSGTPRVINLLCDRSLLVAYSRDSRSVTPQDVVAAKKEISCDVPVMRKKLVPLLAIVIFFFFAGIVVSRLLPDNFASNYRIKITRAEETKIDKVDEQNTDLTATTPTVDLDRINALRAAPAALPPSGSATQAYSAIVSLWNLSLPKRLPKIYNSAILKRALASGGFESVEFQGDITKLLAVDSPAILELVLPNVDGKRFLAILSKDGDLVRTEPALTESGWLAKNELQQIWFGKAIMPYVNHARIRLIDRPGQTGPSVDSLQQLLQQIVPPENLASGVYDRQTIDAITRFQDKYHLAPDGRVGSQTLFWLYKASNQMMPRLASGEGT